MLIKKVKHYNLNNEETTTTLHFNLTKFEWLELETSSKRGLIEKLQSALESDNVKETINILKKILLKAYGEKTEDGEFVKSDELSIKFSKTECFSELFYELAYDENASRKFFMALVPQSMRQEVAEKFEKLEADREESSTKLNGADPIPFK